MICKRLQLLVIQLVKKISNIEQLSNYVDNCASSYAFSIACRDGLLVQAKLLQSIDTSYTIINYDVSFIIACNAGHLDIIEWLIIYPLSDIIVTNMFRASCINNKLDIAKLIFSIKPGINIGYNNYNVFFECCTDNKIKVVKWLLGIDPSIINSHGIMAFMQCRHTQLLVARLLIKLGIFSKYSEEYVGAMDEVLQQVYKL